MRLVQTKAVAESLESGPADLVKLAASTGIVASEIDPVLKALVDAGKVERVGNTEYRLTERVNIWLQMSGDRLEQAFLARLKSLPGVEQQTRFIVPSQDGKVQIAVWSSEPLDEVLPEISSETGASILGIVEPPWRK